MRGQGKLISDIERDALQKGVPIADALRKLIALGGQAGSTELREWASRELRGYFGTGVDLPDYRRPSAVLQIDAFTPGMRITGQQISPRQLPDPMNKHLKEEVPLGQPIGEIDAMLDQARTSGGQIKLTVPDSQSIVTLMNHEVGDPYQNITALYWSLSQPALEGVIDRVKTTLVELIAEMRAGMPENAELPSAEIADQAVNVAVYGRKARVNVHSAHASGSGTQSVSTGPSPSDHDVSWRRVGAIFVGVATVAGTLIALAQWQGWGF